MNQELLNENTQLEESSEAESEAESETGVKMESLLSLVGKDHDTIVEALEGLAKNGEKVKIQEDEIKQLNGDIEEHKEEVHYLRNKLDMKRDIIDDLEHELERKDVEVNELRKALELKEKEFEDLEKFVTARVEEINILRENNQSMVNQIAENIEIEKKLDIQEMALKDFKEQLKDNEKENNILIEDRVSILKEVEKLRNENEVKESLLKSLDEECKDLKEKLGELEKERKEFESNETTVKMLRKFKCDECHYEFESLRDLKIHQKNKYEVLHWKRKLSNWEMNLNDQKMNLVTEILKIKEKEFAEKQTCSCRGWCGINHQKHSWRKSQSDSILLKLNSIKMANAY